MRDLLETLFDEQRPDPMEAARRSARPALRRRFYRRAGVGPEDHGFPVVLDGRPVLSQARRRLAAPNRDLAEALAGEWEAQYEFIDPARMPLTRLANSIIDGVSELRSAVVEEVAKYLASDLVLYRAGEPQELVRRQAAHWDPVLAWVRDEFGARFVLAEGVVHVAQPESALAAVRALIPDDPWRLGAVHAVTTLTGSALLALALLYRRLIVDQAWAAAHVDEDWNIEQWGEDPLARARRANREAEMRAAATVLALR